MVTGDTGVHNTEQDLAMWTTVAAIHAAEYVDAAGRLNDMEELAPNDEPGLAAQLSVRKWAIAYVAEMSHALEIHGSLVPRTGGSIAMQSAAGVLSPMTTGGPVLMDEGVHLTRWVVEIQVEMLAYVVHQLLSNKTAHASNLSAREECVRLGIPQFIAPDTGVTGRRLEWNDTTLSQEAWEQAVWSTASEQYVMAIVAVVARSHLVSNRCTSHRRTRTLEAMGRFFDKVLVAADPQDVSAFRKLQMLWYAGTFLQMEAIRFAALWPIPINMARHCRQTVPEGILVSKEPGPAEHEWWNNLLPRHPSPDRLHKLLSDEYQEKGDSCFKAWQLVADTEQVWARRQARVVRAVNHIDETKWLQRPQRELHGKLWLNEYNEVVRRQLHVKALESDALWVQRAEELFGEGIPRRAVYGGFQDTEQDKFLELAWSDESEVHGHTQFLQQLDSISDARWETLINNAYVASAARLLGTQRSEIVTVGKKVQMEQDTAVVALLWGAVPATDGALQGPRRTITGQPKAVSVRVATTAYQQQRILARVQLYQQVMQFLQQGNTPEWCRQHSRELKVWEDKLKENPKYSAADIPKNSCVAISVTSWEPRQQPHATTTQSVAAAVAPVQRHDSPGHNVTQTTPTTPIMSPPARSAAFQFRGTSSRESREQTQASETRTPATASSYSDPRPHPQHTISRASTTEQAGRKRHTPLEWGDEGTGGSTISSSSGNTTTTVRAGGDSDSDTRRQVQRQLTIHTSAQGSRRSVVQEELRITSTDRISEAQAEAVTEVKEEGLPDTWPRQERLTTQKLQKRIKRSHSEESDTQPTERRYVFPSGWDVMTTHSVEPREPTTTTDGPPSARRVDTQKVQEGLTSPLFSASFRRIQQQQTADSLREQPVRKQLLSQTAINGDEWDEPAQPQRKQLTVTRGPDEWDLADQQRGEMSERERKSSTQTPAHPAPMTRQKVDVTHIVRKHQEQPVTAHTTPDQGIAGQVAIDMTAQQQAEVTSTTPTRLAEVKTAAQPPTRSMASVTQYAEDAPLYDSDEDTRRSLFFPPPTVLTPLSVINSAGNAESPDDLGRRLDELMGQTQPRMVSTSNEQPDEAARLTEHRQAERDMAEIELLLREEQPPTEDEQAQVYYFEGVVEDAMVIQQMFHDKIPIRIPEVTGNEWLKLSYQSSNLARRGTVTNFQAEWTAAMMFDNIPLLEEVGMSMPQGTEYVMWRIGLTQPVGVTLYRQVAIVDKRCPWHVLQAIALLTTAEAKHGMEGQVTRMKLACALWDAEQRTTAGLLIPVNKSIYDRFRIIFAVATAWEYATSNIPNTSDMGRFQEQAVKYYDTIMRVHGYIQPKTYWEPYSTVLTAESGDARDKRYVHVGVEFAYPNVNDLQPLLLNVPHVCKWAPRVVTTTARLATKERAGWIAVVIYAISLCKQTPQWVAVKEWFQQNMGVMEFTAGRQERRPWTRLLGEADRQEAKEVVAKVFAVSQLAEPSERSNVPEVREFNALVNPHTLLFNSFDVKYALQPHYSDTDPSGARRQSKQHTTDYDKYTTMAQEQILHPQGQLASYGTAKTCVIECPTITQSMYPRIRIIAGDPGYFYSARIGTSRRAHEDAWGRWLYMRTLELIRENSRSAK